MFESGTAIAGTQSKSYFTKNPPKAAAALSLDVKIIQRYRCIGLIFVLTERIRNGS